MKIGFGWEKYAGLVCIWTTFWVLHVGVQRGFRVWGHQDDWHDGPIDSWGAGPLFLIMRHF